MGKKVGFWNYFMWLVVVVIIFTAIDSIVHASVEFLEVYYYPIPAAFEFISSSPLFWYAMGKFFGTILLGSLLYPVIKRIKSFPLAIAVLAFTITILLEVRYVISGQYSSMWHLVNFLQHTVTLYVLAYLIFKKSKSL